MEESDINRNWNANKHLKRIITPLFTHSHAYVCWHASIAKGFVRRGIKHEFVVEYKFIERYLKKWGVSVFNIHNMKEEILNSLNVKREIDYLRKKYGISLNQLFYHPRHKKWSDEHRRKMALAYLLIWEKYLLERSPDLTLICDGSEIYYITFNLMAERLGIPRIFYNCGNGPVPDTMILDETSMFNKWVKRDYFKKNLTEVERKRVLEFIGRVKKDKPLIGGTVPVFSFKKIITHLEHMYDYLFSERWDYNPLERARFLNRLINIRRAQKYYSKPFFDERYLFFPLHVPLDAQIVYRASQFFRQDRTVEVVSKSLPAGYYLYVKEHPHSKGMIPIDWLERMSKLPNVKLVPPDTNAHDLIRNAHAIVVINSDVGWEALFYQKPVVVLAEPFYSGFGLTFDVENLNHLPQIIEDALAEKKISKESVLSLLNAAMKSSYDCRVFRSGREFDMGKENIERIVDSILNKYHEVMAFSRFNGNRP